MVVGPVGGRPKRESVVNAEVSLAAIPRSDKRIRRLIEQRVGAHNDVDIDDWLGPTPRDRGAADMFDNTIRGEQGQAIS